MGTAVVHLALTKSFGWLLALGGRAGETERPASLWAASALAGAGVAVIGSGFVGLTLAYATKEGIRPGIDVALICASAILAGVGFLFTGLRQMVNKGAI